MSCVYRFYASDNEWNVFTMLEIWQWKLSLLHSAESVSEILPDFLPLVNLGVVYTISGPTPCALHQDVQRVNTVQYIQLHALV